MHLCEIQTVNVTLVMARINVRIEMSERVQTPGVLDYSGLVKHARLPLNLEYFTK